MKKLFTLCLLAVTMCAVAQEQVQSKRIAILETVDKTDEVDYAYELQLRQSLTFAINKTPGYKGYNRLDMAQINSEHNFQRTGFVSDADIKKLGQMAGAAYVLIAEVTPYSGGKLMILANLVNVESGEIENSTPPVISDMDDTSMTEACKKIAQILLNVSGAPSPTSPQSSYSVGNTNKGGAATGTIAGHEYVDLGLPSGLLWATCNIGASKPEEYGNYYAWGETTTKSNYDWTTYRWFRGSDGNLTKYNTESSYGTVDNRTVLEMSDDAARANWGGDWRMPTTEEWEELNDKCTWTWTTQGGKNGYRVTGPNGKSMFLPAAGYRRGTGVNSAGSFGYYWSSSLGSSGPSIAYFMGFYSGGVGPQNISGRCDGLSVRPVR